MCRRREINYSCNPPRGNTRCCIYLTHNERRCTQYDCDVVARQSVGARCRAVEKEERRGSNMPNKCRMQASNVGDGSKMPPRSEFYFIDRCSSHMRTCSIGRPAGGTLCPPPLISHTVRYCIILHSRNRHQNDEAGTLHGHVNVGRTPF